MVLSFTRTVPVHLYMYMYSRRHNPFCVRCTKNGTKNGKKTVTEMVAKQLVKQYGKRKTEAAQILHDRTYSPHGQDPVRTLQHSGSAKGAKGML